MMSGRVQQRMFSMHRGLFGLPRAPLSLLLATLGLTLLGLPSNAYASGAPGSDAAAEGAKSPLPAGSGSTSDTGIDSPTDSPREMPRPHADDPFIHLAIRDVLAEAQAGKPREPAATVAQAHLRLFYRGFDFHCASGPCWYNGAGFVVYPSSWFDLRGGWQALRLGIGIGGAGESSQKRERWWQHDFLLEAILVVGLGYPWRLTPYAELVVGLGAMHRNLYSKDEIFFAYSFGLEAGLEWFIRGSFHIGASVGWRRSLMKTDVHTLYADSVSFAVFFGF